MNKLEIKTTWEQCNLIFDRINSVNSASIRSDTQKWVSGESLKEYIRLIDRGEKDINDLLLEVKDD